MKSISMQVFLGVLMLSAFACGGVGSQIEPIYTSLPTGGVPATFALPLERTLPSPGATSLPALPAPSAAGLSVAYLSVGNLWMWEASGARQMTFDGRVVAATLTKDGGQLAFIRGGEVWMMHADGSNERMLSMLPGGGGGLFFAPNGLLLAVSMPDHIEVIDVNTGISTNVLAYPSVPGFIPQIVWAMDSYGFKTIIPTSVEGGPAQLHYVFPDGTVANLGSLDLAPLNESLPLLSPDSGYVIYTGKLGGDQRSLYLMDSSGATRPYGEAAARVCALGWQPDSKHFVYFSEGLQAGDYFTGSVDGQPLAGAPFDPFLGRWVDAQRYFLLENGDLYLCDLGGGRLFLAETVDNYSFSIP